MYIVELEKKLYDKVLGIGSSDYGPILEKEDKVYVSLDNVIVMLQDLVDEYDNKEEELEDLQSDVDNYYELKKEDLYDAYGVSRNDF